MNTTDKLQALVAACKATVHLTFNDHKTVYQSVADYLDNDMSEFARDLSPEDRAAMIAKDTVVDLHFYPDTPIGFYKVLHHDLDAALDKALAAIAADRAVG
jgi:hypothetical protein